MDAVDREIGRVGPRRLDLVDVHEGIARAECAVSGLARGGLELLEVAQIRLADAPRLLGRQDRPVPGYDETQSVAVERLEQALRGLRARGSEPASSGIVMPERLSPGSRMPCSSST